MEARSANPQTGDQAPGAWATGGELGARTRTVLGRLSQEACRVASAERAAVVLIEREDARASTVVAGHGLPELASVGDAVQLHRGLEVAEPVLVSGGEVRPGLGHQAAQGVTAVAPIRWSGAVRGALWASSFEPGGLGRQDLPVLGDLAHHAAATLQHDEMRSRMSALGRSRIDALEAAERTRVEQLAVAIDVRDGYSQNHSERVADLAARVAMRLGCDEVAIYELRLAARLRNIGKSQLPLAILHKNAALDRGEREVVERHPEWGAEMLASVPGFEFAATIVRFHHEHIDGTGYPRGLRGQRIPMTSRIVAACGAWEAMISDRPYRAGLEPGSARLELAAAAGTSFDSDVLEALFEVIAEG